MANNLGSQRWIVSDRISTTNLIVSFLALVVASFGAFFIWSTMKDTNKNFVADKRPWVGPSLPTDDKGFLELFPEPAVGRPFQWDLTWKNFGNSPATEVHLRSTAIAASPNLFSERFWNDIATQMEGLDVERSKDVTLFPDALLQNIGISDHNIDDTEMTRFDSGELVVVLIGRVTYRDTLATTAQHQTFICLIYKRSLTSRPAWRGCPIDLRAD